MGYTADRSITTKPRSRESSLPSCAPTLRLLYTGATGIVESPARLLSPGSLELGREAPTQNFDALAFDATVSRRQARIRVYPAQGGQAAKVVIEDLHSCNGLRVNGVRVSEQTLMDGDIVQLGESFLILRYEPARHEDATVPTLIGRSPAIRALRKRLARVSRSDRPVLLLGEPGTGKELAANALHELGRAAGRRGRFEPVNCAAIVESLAESELFGHRAGAFTGARHANEGRFRRAHGGTLFLDEVGELPPSIQAKLLRALQERMIDSVGGGDPQPVDVRVIAATNRNLRPEANSAVLRPDLLARLSTHLVELPSLRDRREDILPLFLHLWGSAPLPPLSLDLVEALLLHGWPGNVRELGNLVEELKLYVDEVPILELSLVAPLLMLPSQASSTPTHSLADASDNDIAEAVDCKTVRLPARPRWPPISEPDLRALLARHGGNLTRAAKEANRDRSQLRRYFQYYLNNKAEPPERVSLEP